MPDGRENLEDVLKYDPFSPSEGENGEENGEEEKEGQVTDPDETSAEDSSPEGGDGGDGGEETDDKSKDPSQKKAPDQAPAQPQPTVDPQVAAVQAMLAQGLQQPQQPQKEPEKKEGKEEPKPPRFNLGIPPQLLQAMQSEDPTENGQALHALVNGVANAVWKEVESVLEETVGGLKKELPQVIQQHASHTEQMRAVAMDFYGRYPEFNQPALKPVIQNVAMAMAQQQQATTGQTFQWNEAFRDQLAQILRGMFPGLVQQTQTQPQPQTKPNGKGGKQFASGRGTRPAGRQEDKVSADIMDTLDLR